MKLSVVYQPSLPASSSPYRLRDKDRGELEWANAFLDGQHVRLLSPRSLRIYAYDLLDFARWFQPQHRPLAEITESTIVDYVRHQLEQDPGQEISADKVHFQRRYTKRSPLGYGRPRRAIAYGLRLKQDHRVIVPLSSEEVAKFWQTFRSYRDLGLVGLMLWDGLRSCEVLGLQLEDLQLSEGQLRVPGKGNKQRLVPLPPEILEVLGHYLRLERPLTNAPSLFVSLKGRHRGQPMTAAGLRSLFRHHRVLSQVPRANPHRWRHTFGRDMVRAGMSLPALQQLMGHSQISTTMLYVELAPQDVWREYAQAIEKRKQLGSEHIS